MRQLRRFIYKKSFFRKIRLIGEWLSGGLNGSDHLSHQENTITEEKLGKLFPFYSVQHLKQVTFVLVFKDNNIPDV